MNAKRKKTKRIVLGVGHPWYALTRVKGCGYFAYTNLQLTKTPVPNSILLRHGLEKLVEFDPHGTGNWNKVRLVLEVLS